LLARGYYWRYGTKVPHGFLNEASPCANGFGKILDDYTFIFNDTFCRRAELRAETKARASLHH
jgi:hypothetical protein